MLSLGAFPWDNAAGLQPTGSAAGASLERRRWSEPALAIHPLQAGAWARGTLDPSQPTLRARYPAAAASTGQGTSLLSSDSPYTHILGHCIGLSP